VSWYGIQSDTPQRVLVIGRGYIVAGNHNSGRRPQSTALKLLRGNPGKRRLNPAEVKPPPGDAVKPVGLSAGAGEVWDELAPVCLAMGTLTVADVRVFATLCELQATFMAAAGRKGTEHFDARLERETATALRPYYSLFGLEPVSRARVAAPKKDQPESKWAGALR
jgi:phage terminase small subunit